MCAFAFPRHQIFVNIRRSSYRKYIFKSQPITCSHIVLSGRGLLCFLFLLLIVVDVCCALADESNTVVWKGSNCGKPVPGQQATLCPHVVQGHVVPSMASESIFSTCACRSLCAQTHTLKLNIYIFILLFSSPQDANKGASVCSLCAITLWHCISLLQ